MQSIWNKYKIGIGVAVAVLALGIVWAMASPAKADGLPRSGLVPIGEVAAAGTNWTGFYVGGHGGQSWSDLNVSANDGFDAQVLFPGSETANGKGWIGGLQAGANYQAGPWVFGVEADISWPKIDDADHFFATQKYIDKDGKDGTSWTDDTSIDRFGTIRGRLGLATGPVLIYGTGGWAWADVEGVHAVADGPKAPHAVSTVSQMVNGYAVGGGLEWAITSNLTLRGEYLYLDFGRESFAHNVGNKSGDPDLTSADLNMHVIRAGLNLKFGGK